MNTPLKYQRKSYAMQRMAQAIERAIEAESDAEKARAARWAAAWGVLGGIRSPGIRLRRDTLLEERRSTKRD